MRIEHATIDGKVIITEVPEAPAPAEPIEPAAPSIESLAAAVQVIAERVGMSKAEAETLVRSTRDAVAVERIPNPPYSAGTAMA